MRTENAKLARVICELAWKFCKKFLKPHQEDYDYEGAFVCYKLPFLTISWSAYVGGNESLALYTDPDYLCVFYHPKQDYGIVSLEFTAHTN